MRVLSNVRPTAEQLKVINDYRPGVMVVRGAAGSGKTTTAVLRLRLVAGVWRRAARRAGEGPVRVLVLSFNRTLRGYVDELVRQQLTEGQTDLTIDTFAGWAFDIAGRARMVDDGRNARLAGWGRGLGLSTDFLASEVDYVLGRYLPDELTLYSDTSDAVRSRRVGRGEAPVMGAQRRRRLLGEVIAPYAAWKAAEGVLDWNDLAIAAKAATTAPYDVVVIDESQDFSANMVRAVLAHLAVDHSVTFVLDATQRVYPHAFRWNAVGLDVRGRDVVTLKTNHRNTRQIAALARPLVEGLPDDEDGQLPDFETCTAVGAMPVVVAGSFSEQMDWVIQMVTARPADESVALLHPKGGGWFNYARSRLATSGVGFVELQARRSWPSGPEQVGLLTLYSAKGLEFDHVVLLGLEQDHMPHGGGSGDTQLEGHRRLVAMAIGRARRTVAIAYKPQTRPDVLDLLDPSTYVLAGP